MDEKKKIDDIVAMLDNFVTNGGGHMNLQIDDNESEDVIIETYKSTDCSTGNMACKVPTLHKGIDD